MKNGCFLIFIIIFSSFVGFAQNETKITERKINLIVTDNKNNFVSDLSKEDILIKVNGKESQNFTIEKETLPILYMICLDNSGSMRFLLDDIIQTTKNIIEQNQVDDLTALMRFVSKDIIQTTEKFSNDKQYLFSNLDLFQIEGGQTALIDAIYNGVKVVSNQKGLKENYRRTLIVVSDGEDRLSENSQKDLNELLAKNDVQVFFIGLVNDLDDQSGVIRESPRKKAMKFIENIADRSGGVGLFSKKPEDIKEIAEQIVPQMRTQINIKILGDENLKSSRIEISPSKNSKKKKLNFHYKIVQ